MTMICVGTRVCAKTLSIASRIISPRLYVGMTTLTETSLIRYPCLPEAPAVPVRRRRGQLNPPTRGLPEPRRCLGIKMEDDERRDAHKHELARQSRRHTYLRGRCSAGRQTQVDGHYSKDHISRQGVLPRRRKLRDDGAHDQGQEVRPHPPQLRVARLHFLGL